MLVQEGVRFMQGATMQWIVGGGSGSVGSGSGGSGSRDSDNAGYGIQVERRFMGQRYASGLIGQIRNVHFEPTEWWHQHAQKNSSGPIGSFTVDSDSVKRALHQIRTAFLWRMPAVVSTHRVNYSGVMDPALRDWNLAQLRTLLEHILYLWPDVKFVTAEELGNRMMGHIQHG